MKNQPQTTLTFSGANFPAPAITNNASMSLKDATTLSLTTPNIITFSIALNKTQHNGTLHGAMVECHMHIWRIVLECRMQECRTNPLNVACHECRTLTNVVTMSHCYRFGRNVASWILIQVIQEKEGGIQVLAGLAPSSPKVASNIEDPEAVFLVMSDPL